MRKTALTLALVLAMLTISGVYFVKLVETNPMEGPYSPTEPIRDPPKIVINSPINVTYYQNIIPLKIKVVQPDSWVTNHSDPNVWVIGPNSLRLVSCELDGESFVLWNGTWAQIGRGNSGVCYYLPKYSFFSARMNVNGGHHILRVNVQAVAEYYSPPNYPFPRKYNIATSQNVSFFVQPGLGVVLSPGIEFIDTPVVPFPPNDFVKEELSRFVPLIGALVAVAIIAGLGLLFYCIKRRQFQTLDKQRWHKNTIKDQFGVV